MRLLRRVSPLLVSDPFRRLSFSQSSQKWLWIYKFQPLYAPVLYILLGMTFVSFPRLSLSVPRPLTLDLPPVFESRISTTPSSASREELSRSTLSLLSSSSSSGVERCTISLFLFSNETSTKTDALSALFQIFFFVHRLVIPLAFSRASTTAVIASFLLSDFVFSFASAIIFQVRRLCLSRALSPLTPSFPQASHVTSDVAWPLPNPETGDMNEDWCRSQVETGQDCEFAPLPRLSFHLRKL